MASVESIVVKLQADNRQMLSKLNESTASLSRFGRGASTVAKSMTAAFAGIATGLSVGLVVRSVRDVADEMDRLSKLAQKVGSTTEELSTLGYAADLSGVSMDSLATALKRVAVNSADTQRGTGDAKYAFDALGISVEDTVGNLKGSTVLLGEVADKFRGMEDGAGKTAIAMKLFGKAGADLIPLLNEGSGGIEDMRDEARKLGIEISGDLAKSAEEFNDNLTKISTSAKGFRQAVIDKMLPGLADVSAAMVEAAKDSGVLKAAWVALGGLGAYLFTDEFDSDTKKLDTLRQKLSGLQRHLKDKNGQGLVHDWIYGDAIDMNAQIDQVVAEITALQDKINKRLNPDNPTEKPKSKAPALIDTAAESRKQAKEFKEAFKEIDAAVEANDKAVAKANEEYVTWMKNMQDAADAIRETINPMDALETKLQKLDMLFAGGFFGDGPEAFNTYAEAVFNANEELEKTAEKTKEASDFAKDMGLTFASSFEEAVLSGDKLRDVLKGLSKDILAITLRKTVTEPAGNFITDLLGSIPFFASGTNFAPGGLAVVGERGPELVNLPRGSQVIPNGAVGGITINVDARGSSDPSATERSVRRAVDEAVQTLRSMKQRGQLPEFA